MNILPWIVVAWLFLVGLYGLATSRNMIRIVGCLFVVQSSTYVLLLSVGYRRAATAPILTDVPARTPVVDSVVQALTLTDVVVGAGVSALVLVFAIQAQKKTGSLDPDTLRPMRG